MTYDPTQFGGSGEPNPSAPIWEATTPVWEVAPPVPLYPVAQQYPVTQQYPVAQYAPQGYYPGPVAEMPSPQKATVDLLAWISLGCAAVGWFVLPLFIPAIICGHVSRSRSRRAGLPESGWALAGMIAGYCEMVLVVLGLLAVILFIAVFAAAGM